MNDAIIAPTLSNATPTTIQAQTCASCDVELYVADGAAGLVGSGQDVPRQRPADSNGKRLVHAAERHRGSARW